MTYEKMQQKLKGLRNATEHNGMFYSTVHEDKLLTAEGIVEEMSLQNASPIVVTGDNGERFNAISFVLQSAYRQGMREEKYNENR